jgi:hypothetical protein
VAVINETGNVLELPNQFLILPQVLLFQLHALEMRFVGVDSPVVNNAKLPKGGVDYTLDLLRYLLQLLDLPLKKLQFLLLPRISTKLHRSPFPPPCQQLVHTLRKAVDRSSHVFKVVYHSALLNELSLGLRKVELLIEQEVLELVTETHEGMSQQFLQIPLQFLGPQLLKFCSLKVEVSKEVFQRQPGEDVAAVVVDELVMQELEVVKSATNHRVKGLTAVPARLDLVEFIAGEVALLHQLGLLYLQDAVQQKLHVVVELNPGSNGLVLVHEVDQVLGVQLQRTHLLLVALAQVRLSYLQVVVVASALEGNQLVLFFHYIQL